MNVAVKRVIKRGTEIAQTNYRNVEFIKWERTTPEEQEVKVKFFGDDKVHTFSLESLWSLDIMSINKG